MHAETFEMVDLVMVLMLLVWVYYFVSSETVASNENQSKLYKARWGLGKIFELQVGVF